MDVQPENVADYPRPPALVACGQHIEVWVLGERLVDTRRSLRVLETFHPPTYYLPPEAVRWHLLEPTAGCSFCEWKGVAAYFSVVVGDQRLERVAWSYSNPTPAFAPLAGWLAVYPGRMDGCWVDGELVQAQPGGFYGGWITSAVRGPFKGDPQYPNLI
jgi:uncharacterized protein (DUF427 family)